MTAADRPAPGLTLDWGSGRYETTAGELEPVAVSAVTAFTPPPFPWANRTAVSELVARAGAEASFSEGRLTFTGSSPEQYFDEVHSAHPMSVATRPLLENGGVHSDVRQQMIAALAGHNEEPTGLGLTSRYVVVAIQRPVTS